MTAITWTKTETRTETTERKCRLGVFLVSGDGEIILSYESATAADVIEAIEADEGLHGLVEQHLGIAVVSERLAREAAESDRDAWKARAEKAEKARDDCATAIQNVYGSVNMITGEHWAQDGIAANMARRLVERFEAIHDKANRAEKERDTAIQQRREAEKERDEARAEVDKLAKLIGSALLVPTLRDDEIMTSYEPHALMAAMFEYRATVSEQRATIARLERELAEARVYADYSGECRDQEEIAADALELRARRALDEWERDAFGRKNAGIRMVVGINGPEWQAWDHNANTYKCAPDAVTLARKLGIIP